MGVLGSGEPASTAVFLTVAGPRGTRLPFAAPLSLAAARIALVAAMAPVSVPV